MEKTVPALSSAKSCNLSYIINNPHRFITNDWIDASQLRDFLHHTSNSTPQPSISLPARVKLESDAVDESLMRPDSFGPGIFVNSRHFRLLISPVRPRTRSPESDSYLPSDEHAGMVPDLEVSDTLWADSEILLFVRIGDLRVTTEVTVQRMEYLTEFASLYPIPNVATASERVAREMEISIRSGVLINSQNESYNRRARNTTRQSTAMRKSNASHQLADERAEIELEIEAIRAEKQDSAPRLKALQTRKSEIRKMSKTGTSSGTRTVVVSASSSGRVKTRTVGSNSTAPLRLVNTEIIEQGGSFPADASITSPFDGAASFSAQFLAPASPPRLPPIPISPSPSPIPLVTPLAAKPLSRKRKNDINGLDPANVLEGQSRSRRVRK
ncbi:hypothetical protein DFH08DRAFT_1042869 [Mycena albidolilacea]|uniref:Uncharacterized protein n=1 Tax=Mycena albidolilacea TaxID=1033008 RepID=A0AAD7EXS7_9AGAR|nr:hypothetical protein DFH08DRAFT_1042869 [Mycena albidolilacea]